ncbi:DUF4177 domain-containing protein [Stenotrophomonas maltophilia]|jgi:hypothetical protein|uniref:DUF4177 domain-containing protein n=1 Tax=Stenotrophomonas maltophilia TaxID=40324 RepID=A0AAP7GR93_STEMA|nr:MULTISPECIES: DUF4177 domain-containing protein [Stenotrophomonas]KOQ71112.1 hypothetical protein ABW43_02510 [Stenotrophomonas maltophilia]MBA0220628.1 DUF4177 domain-containing protein [Stenotrophomonas maltophilia]MBE5270896.1 DUF4177 domain-containing protein [Stenotrophomonas sp. B2]MBH1594024.1 DUF4177 domain-containing protein [Stenotrophomonas maltophilia]MBH1666532.1 DUF4177 domain-containing protein [Stenotrophomonas maltophilia]
MSKRWTYQTLEVPSTLMGSMKTEAVQEALNKQGQLGWELVNIVIPAPMSAAVLVFKKEL